jgi:peptidoglycan biosynthesis protein MviN/MurJ (putative lipid II flippase)
VLNLTLIWPLAEAGLALSTTIATVVQLSILTATFSRRQAPLGWRALAATSARAILATSAMAAAVYVVLPYMPMGDTFLAKFIHVGTPILLGTATYCGAYLLLGGRELGMLWSGKVED